MKKLLERKLSRNYTLAILILFFVTTPIVAQAQEMALKAVGAFGANAIGWLLSPIAVLLLTLSSLVTMLSGTILNFVINYTIVDMAANYSKVPAIEEAWGVARDLSNMVFIFLLLYAAIQMILGIGKDIRKLIVNMVIVALLINFSLFFTKVIIDAANLLALTFYKAIVPNVALGDITSRGLSNSITDLLGIQTLFKAGAGFGSGDSLVIIGVLGTIILLISAFVFFAAAMLFIIRYVVLILVIVLSPFAFVSFIFPKMNDEIGKKWWDALFGQAFFAPIFFVLMWISISILQGIGGPNKDFATALGGTLDPSTGVNKFNPTAVSTIVNFIIVIVFVIAAIVLAKKWADKAGGGMDKLTGAAIGKGSGFFFGGVIGGAGRNTLGRIGKRMAGDSNLILAADGPGIAGARARLNLGLARKMASGTFDPRNMTAPLDYGLADTRLGRKFNLDKLRLGVGATAASQTGVGQGGDKGFQEISIEKDKREREIEAKKQADVAISKAKLDVLTGAKDTATPAEIEAMEKALGKLTDKQTETLLTGNRDLLDKQNFANKISVQQLEAINKSDQFSDTEKNKLKENRFKVVQDPIRLAALSVPPAARTPAEATMADEISKAIKSLSDTELDMIDAALLANPDFVGQLRPPQVESVTKSKKFTSGQKTLLNNARRQPLIDALNAGNVVSAQNIIKKMGPKDIVGLMSVPGRGGVNIPFDPAVLSIFTPQLLRRMSQEMNQSDITNLRNAILTHGNPATVSWLNDPLTGGQEFS